MLSYSLFNIINGFSVFNSVFEDVDDLLVNRYLINLILRLLSQLKHIITIMLRTSNIYAVSSDDDVCVFNILRVDCFSQFLFLILFLPLKRIVRRRFKVFYGTGDLQKKRSTAH